MSVSVRSIAHRVNSDDTELINLPSPRGEIKGRVVTNDVFTGERGKEKKSSRVLYTLQLREFIKILPHKPPPRKRELIQAWTIMNESFFSPL